MNVAHHGCVGGFSPSPAIRALARALPLPYQPLHSQGVGSRLPLSLNRFAAARVSGVLFFSLGKHLSYNIDS